MLKAEIDTNVARTQRQTNRKYEMNSNQIKQRKRKNVTEGISSKNLTEGTSSSTNKYALADITNKFSALMEASSNSETENPQMEHNQEMKLSKIQDYYDAPNEESFVMEDNECKLFFDIYHSAHSEFVDVIINLSNIFTVFQILKI